MISHQVRARVVFQVYSMVEIFNQGRGTDLFPMHNLGSELQDANFHEINPEYITRK